MNSLQPNRHICILVVDDHPSTANTLSRAIAQLDPKIEVLTATSGEKALEIVRDKSVDLVITDMMMDGINGLELIEKLQSHPAGRPAYTMLITAYDVPGLKITAQRLKVNDILIKPVRPERVCQIITKAMDGFGKAEFPALSEVRSRSKILIADDIPDNITLLSRFLGSEGYTCITAKDGIEALTKLRAEMPDLVLLDMNMPVKDGLETLQEIRSDPATSHIPVIIVTAARLAPMDMQYALNIGADDYITKPFDRRELIARIRTRLRVKETEDLIRRRNKELNLLPEIGRELSARLDVEELSTLILRRTVETLGALLGHILLLDPKISLQKTYHFSKKITSASEFHLPDLTPILTQLKDTRQGLIVGDVQKDAHWTISEGDQTRSVIIAPLFGRFDLLGLLILSHEQAGYFSLEHLLLLQAIASQAAIAIENAQLFVSMEQEQQRLNAIIQNVSEGILMFDNKKQLMMINAAGKSLFTDELCEGQFITPGTGYDSLLILLEKTYQTKTLQTGKVIYSSKHLDAVASPTEGGVVVTLRDYSGISKRKEAVNVASSKDLTYLSEEEKI
ncbi:MAG TPA: response regulator [Anaerolineales bacterium]